MNQTREIPRPALVLGLSGLIPFAAGAAVCLLPNAEVARHGLMALSFYGAVILSFLGGVRWGVLISADPPTGSTSSLSWSGMVLSVTPSLIAWPALLLRPAVGLTLLLAGFILQYLLDLNAAKRGILPGWYGKTLRTILSAGAVAALLVGLLATTFRMNV